MASQVSIFNRALIKLGEATVLSVNDNLKPARTLLSIYDATRDAELRAHNWNFAIKRTRLSALVATPDWGWDLQYELPSDFLRLVQVNEFYVRTGIKQTTPFSLEGNRILTNLQAPLAIRYVARITDTTQFDALFVDALACKLAMEACETLTQSAGKLQAVAAQYNDAIKRAVFADSIENPPDELSWGSWLQSREGATDFTVRADGSLGTSGFEIL
jgi:hypothetical protein